MSDRPNASISIHVKKVNQKLHVNIFISITAFFSLVQSADLSIITGMALDEQISNLIKQDFQFEFGRKSA